MHRRLSSKRLNDTPLPSNWVDYIQDDRLRRAIPIGPRFQADIPSLMPDDKDQNRKKYMAESSKWLGTKIWEPKRSTLDDDDDDKDVGKGRPDMCPCEFTGNVECIKMHMVMKRVKLQFELGYAFTEWKFDEMGEVVSTLWTLEDQKKFEFIVKMNCIPNGIGFLKPALVSFPSRSWQNIVSYFFNVYLQRRISDQSRRGCEIVDSDEEAAKGESAKVEAAIVEAKPGSTRKRWQAGVGTSRGARIGKTRFLAGKK